MNAAISELETFQVIVRANTITFFSFSRHPWMTPEITITSASLHFAQLQFSRLRKQKPRKEVYTTTFACFSLNSPAADKTTALTRVLKMTVMTGEASKQELSKSSRAPFLRGGAGRICFAQMSGTGSAVVPCAS